MEKLKTPFAKQLFAEFFGTFALVFVGCGAIIVHTLTNAISHFGIALSFGLVVMTMISVTSHVSMAHFNPAVTFAFALTNYFPWKKVLPYWISQLLGASLAAALLEIFFGSIANLGATTPANTTSQSFWLELLLTAILMFVILAVATDAKADGTSCRHYDWRYRCYECFMGWANQWCLYEPCSFLWPCLAQWHLASPLDLLASTSDWCQPWGTRLHIDSFRKIERAFCSFFFILPSFTFLRQALIWIIIISI
jgi:hypothetical protein